MAYILSDRYKYVYQTNNIWRVAGVKGIFNTENEAGAIYKELIDPDLLLEEGAAYNSIDWINKAIKIGANINRRTFDSAPAAAVAAVAGGHLKILKYFLNCRGLKLSKKGIDYLLYLAAQVGELDIVKFLIEKLGADPQYHDNDVVFYCWVEGHQDVVNYLISKGAVLNHDKDDDSGIITPRRQ